MPDSYDIQDGVRFAVTFSVNGVATDPTTITARVVKGKWSGSQNYLYGTDVEVVKTGTGAYYIDLVFDNPGEWVVHWVATGTVKAAVVDRVAVTTSPAYAF